jgi:hypothetical protein
MCAFSFLSSSAVLMADLPAPPTGPVRTVDAVSNGEVETPIWLGPAIDDGRRRMERKLVRFWFAYIVY